ncbi:MAG: Rv3235 family protein [Bifidobacteriaceae bacterium]|jgi:hypothetical protein|nr:Rv3235 family protein [Bifidobacteriaceae bacterium]
MPAPRLGRPSRDPDLCAKFLAVWAIAVADGVPLNPEVVRFVTPEVWQSLTRQARANVRSGARGYPMAARVLLKPVAKGVIEATIICHQPDRVRAVALRMEQGGGGWRADQLAVVC